MRQSELLGFNKLLKTLDLEVNFNERFTKDQNWEDVPFEDLKVLNVSCFGKLEKSYRNFSTPPNWFQILKCVDEILVIRVLGDRIEPIFDIFISLWSTLRSEWLQLPACKPRIWDT